MSEEPRCRNVFMLVFNGSVEKGLRLCCKSRRKKGNCYRVEKTF